LQWKICIKLAVSALSPRIGLEHAKQAPFKQETPILLGREDQNRTQNGGLGKLKTMQVRRLVKLTGSGRGLVVT
jgi:hypothetical protein